MILIKSIPFKCWRILSYKTLKAYFVGIILGSMPALELMMYQLQAQDVNFAMEASRKSRNAFAAAKASLGVGKNSDGISSIKKALDFSFQDVEGLLRLVRLAVEAINR